MRKKMFTLFAQEGIYSIFWNGVKWNASLQNCG